MIKLTARHVVERLIAGVPGRQWDALPALYASDAVVEHPMQLPVPTRLSGRESVARHFAAASQLPLEMRAENVLIHQTGDPEVVVAEFDYRVRNTRSGSQFTVANVFVVRVREGLIVESRDYSNHALFAATFGRLGAVADELQPTA